MTNAYELLKAYGHSPAKAAEIVLDAKRGDFFSQGWIAVVESSFSRDRNAKRHDQQGHGPKDESANSSNPNHATPNESR